MGWHRRHRDREGWRRRGFGKEQRTRAEEEGGSRHAGRKAAGNSAGGGLRGGLVRGRLGHGSFPDSALWLPPTFPGRRSNAGLARKVPRGLPPLPRFSGYSPPCSPDSRSADLLCFRGRTQPHPPLPSPGPLGPHFPAHSLPPLLLWTAGPEARACDPAVYLGIQFAGVGESTKERGSQCERLVTATGHWCSIPWVRVTSVSGLSAQGVDGETTYPLVPVPVGSLLSLGPVHE